MNDYSSDMREGGPINRMTSAFQAPEPDALPPMHLEAEMSCLGAMIHDNAKIDIVLGIVQAGDFFRDAHQIIFRRIEFLHGKGDAVDMITLIDDLRTYGLEEAVGGLEYLSDICGIVPHAANAHVYAAIVKGKAKARLGIELGKELVRRGQSQHSAPDDVLDRAAEMIESMRSGVADDDLSINALPAKMADAAFRGVIGEIVEIIGPHTESSPESILGQVLVTFGNVIGRRAHWRINATCHHANLFLCIVGPTGTGRKGTSWDAARWLIGQSNPEFDRRPVMSGLTTGEGLIRLAKEQNGPLLVVESEMGRLLKNGGRDNNTLFDVLKQAWETGAMSVATRNEPLWVPDAHVSIITHSTYGKLRKRISQEDLEDGLVNRFIWMHTYRARSLPEGGDFFSLKQALAPYVQSLTFAIDFGKANDSIKDVPYIRDDEAKEMWRHLYEQLTESLPGNYGEAVQRRAPIVARLAMIYSVLDRDVYVRKEHIESAMAVWDYCDATAAHIFGKPKTDKALGKLMAILDQEEVGLTRTQIARKLFAGRGAGSEIDSLIQNAYATGKYLYKELKTGGAPRRVLLHKKYGMEQK
jgi:hypothetical protein